MEHIRTRRREGRGWQSEVSKRERAGCCKDNRQGTNSKTEMRKKMLKIPLMLLLLLSLTEESAASSHFPLFPHLTVTKLLTLWNKFLVNLITVFVNFQHII